MTNRRKSRWDLIRISAAVMGIEFSYAAETAFVSPLLLKIGVKHQKMTLVWALSPLVGFFLCPLMGSFSDKCRSKMGRRRPFIILLSIGVLLGLLLVPNGELLGLKFGDTPDTVLPGNFTTIDPITGFEEDVQMTEKGNHAWGIFFTIIGTVLLDFDADVRNTGSVETFINCDYFISGLSKSSKSVSTGRDSTRGQCQGTIYVYHHGGIRWIHGLLLGCH